MESEYLGQMKVGRMKAAVFKNEQGDYRFIIEKPYKNKETGEWAEYKNIYGSDIIDLAELCLNLKERFDLEKSSSSGWYPVD
jgi:hypothetical protein